MKKKYIRPELEFLEALFTEDVLYASTGEDAMEDVGNTAPPIDDIPTFEDFTEPTISAERPGEDLGDDWW